jgi:hypothetical protein
LNKLTYKFWKKVNPSLFQSPDFSKIDENEEGLLDYCPICNEQLPDRKVRTFKMHEYNNHRKSDEERLKMINRNMKIFVILFGSMGLLMTIPMLLVWIPEIQDDMDGWTTMDDCFIQKSELQLRAMDNKGFVESDIDDLNHLFEYCGGGIKILPDDEKSLMYLLLESVMGTDDITYFGSDNLENHGEMYEELTESLEELQEKKIEQQR